MILRKVLHLFFIDIGTYPFLILLMLQEQQAFHYEMHKNIALQRRVALRQSDRLEEENEKVQKT
jgi:hypothetical protein